MIPLQEPAGKFSDDRSKLCIIQKDKTPPYSELEVMAGVDKSFSKGTWLVEESTETQIPVMEALVHVRVTTNRVPVCLLNPSPELITVHGGTEVAILESVEVPTKHVSAG